MAKYRRKPLVIDAVKITTSIKVNTEDGIVEGNKGDYLITEPNGKQYPCNAEQFEKTYELVKSFDVKKLLRVAYRVIKYKSNGFTKS